MEKEKMKQVNENEQENKIAYLQLLQEPISRMSSTSAIYKGFAAAILAGLASASFTDISKWALLIGLLPIIAFLSMDIYYLRLERIFKYRYRMVNSGRAGIDYSIEIKLDKDELKEARARIRSCLLSASILLFYVPIIICAVALFILKLKGVLG